MRGRFSQPTVAGALLAVGILATACLPAARGAGEIPWQAGPCVGELGPYATVKVPEGYVFTGPEGAPAFLELTHNPPDPSTMGVLVPTSEDDSFVLFFNYEDSGHVKDDDKDSIDPVALLASLKAGSEAGNAERRRRGWEEIHVTDWIVPPGYEAETNRLAWGVAATQSSGGELANYDVRLLGRTGVMSATLTCSPDQVRPLIPRLQDLLGGFEFKSGHRYAEWRSGDKLATYGLTGLVAGGAAVAAAKSGLLGKLLAGIAKMGKVIVVAVAALLGGIWKLLTGKSSKPAQ